MAQVVEQHTPTEIERSLDDYVADLIATLGYERYPALWEMWERIATKRLLFIRQRLVDGKPYSPWDHPTIHGTPKPYFPEVVDANDFRSNYKFEFDDHDRVKVFSHEWSNYRYTVAEPPRPPASQTAPDQQRKAKAGPEPSKKPNVNARLLMPLNSAAMATVTPKRSLSDRIFLPVTSGRILPPHTMWKLW